MKSRFSLIPVALAGMALAGAAQAYDRPGGMFYDQARVVDVRPIVEVVRVAAPQQECWTEPVRHVHRTGPDGGAYVMVSCLESEAWAIRVSEAIIFSLCSPCSNQ